MPKYTVDYLYNEFKTLAGMRNDPQYANDSTYWVGGNCNWGGSHNLREDCATIAKEMEKMQSLDGEKIKAELNKCTSQGEYESKKRDYLRTAEELSRGFQPRTGYSSSMFGICIIWADCAMSPFIANKMQDCRQSLDNLKGQIEGEKYQHVEELRLLKLAEKKIKDRISELKRDANKEKDPTKKARILLLIEEEGKKLEDNLRQQKAIPASGINYNPSEFVEGFIEAIRKALRGDSGGNPDRPNKPNKPKGDDLPDGSGGGSLPDDNTDPNRPSRRRNQGGKDKDNSQIVLIAIAALIAIFFLMNQKEKSREEDYY